MLDLKPYLDTANAASDEVQRILGEMDAAFKDRTEEGKNKALELRPALDGAKAKAEAADKLYRSMRDASITDGGQAAKFAPVLPPPGDSGEEKPDPKVMKRKEFEALDHPARGAFMAAGGTIVDEA